MTSSDHDHHHDQDHGHGNTVVPDAEARDRLWELIKGTRFSMFTARHGNGHLHARPMTMQNAGVDEDSSLWYFMSLGSEPVADLAKDPEVNVTFVDVSKDTYVSVSGRAAVVNDLAKKQQLWSKMAEAWFTGGPEDPDLALVQVHITHADYWDVKESKLVQLFKMAKAVVTGTPPTDLGEHAQIRMR
jgi:general stress protein 26